MAPDGVTAWRRYAPGPAQYAKGAVIRPFFLLGSETEAGSKTKNLGLKRGPSKQHIVPLPKAAVAILRALRPHSSGELVCPSTRPGRPISENTLKGALRVLQDRGLFAGDHDPHGFRKTASTLLHEAGFDHRVIEAQLAHKEPGVAGVYNRALYLDERRHLMHTYATLLDGLKAGRPWHELVIAVKAGSYKSKSTQARKSTQGSAHAGRGSKRLRAAAGRPAGAEVPELAGKSA